MKCTPILLAIGSLIFCALFAGCTSPTQVEIKPSQTTTLPTPPPTTSTSTATVVSTPLAVETLPAEQAVDIVVYKQRPDATIHMVYNGGTGEMFVQNIMMRITRSDRTVAEEKYLNDGTRRPQRGDELVMDGSRGTDQVAVFVTSSGTTYKIYDKPLANPYY
ncbi:MAG: hypothetical protein WC294_08295 [Methanoregula sp.]